MEQIFIDFLQKKLKVNQRRKRIIGRENKIRRIFKKICKKPFFNASWENVENWRKQTVYQVFSGEISKLYRRLRNKNY